MTSRNRQIQNTIKVASKYPIKMAWDKIITASKISEKAETEYFGFHFATHGLYDIGDRIIHTDGSVSVVEAIC
jgi:hypothetical protein